MKDLIPTMVHELRAPLTSVRALSEILHDNPNIEVHRRQEFLSIILKETERLSHLVDNVMDVPDIFSMVHEI
jgi:signal transduction histidine kinase